MHDASYLQNANQRNANMKRAIALPLWTLVLGALVLWGLARYDASVTRQQGAFVEQATRALEAGKAFRARQARFQNAATMAQNRATLALGRADSLSRTLLSLRQALPADSMVARPVVDSLLAVAEQRDSLRLAAIAGLTRAVEAERQRAAAAEARVSQLEKTLAVGVKVADCHIAGLGFLPRCPSRTASLVLGAGLGATAVILAR